MWANVAADRALANGTASTKAAANALHLLEYKNRFGCTMTKAHANRMISCLALCSTDRATAKKLHDDARVGHQPFSFYKCPDAAVNLDREHRREHHDRANQRMFHNGGGGTGPSTTQHYSRASDRSQGVPRTRGGQR